MEENGITHVINATCEQPNVFEDGGKIKYLRVAVNDTNAADLMPHFKRVNEFIGWLFQMNLMQCVVRWLINAHNYSN